MTIKLLIADDHGVVRDGLCALFKPEIDITIVGCADNGRQAVKQVLKLSPDVVTMDIAMPILNGILATEQIMKTHPDTRIIILSMHASKEYISSSFKAGAIGYLLKESVGKEVVQAVRSVYSGIRYLGQGLSDIVFDQYVDMQTDLIHNPIDLLSSREKEILQMVVEGKSSTQIAKILCLSSKTIDTYRSRLMRKLSLKGIPSLVKFAIRHGVTTTE
jgi:two-component system, NarL family, response regulator NreC